MKPFTFAILFMKWTFLKPWDNCFFVYVTVCLQYSSQLKKEDLVYQAWLSLVGCSEMVISFYFLLSFYQTLIEYNVWLVAEHYDIHFNKFVSWTCVYIKLNMDLVDIFNHFVTRLDAHLMKHRNMHRLPPVLSYFLSLKYYISIVFGWVVLK